jgi:hypothetical protein
MTLPTDGDASAHSPDSTELLQTLDRKKRALEEVIHVAQTVERLQQGLQAVLLMGASTSRIPRHVLQFYRGLDARLRGQPVRELSGLLGGFEKAIRNDLGQIMQLAVVGDAALIEQRDPAAGDAGASADAVGRLAEDFRRRVQTAVYLRVLLQEQGFRTEPLELAVPAEQIQQQITVLEQRGRQCRLKAQDEVRAVLADIERCLSSATIPEALKASLREVQTQLQANLAHLGSGKPVDEMPFAIETFLLQEDQPVEPARVPDNRRSPLASGEGGATADGHSAVVGGRRTAAEGRETAAGNNPRPGIFRSLWLWCITPPEVSWKTIRRGVYSARRRKPSR